MRIYVNDVRESSAPTDIRLSNTKINENVASYTTVGTFSTTDPDAGDTFTYALVSGTGDRDNAAFVINDDRLRIKSSPDYDTQSSYKIRVRTTDADGETYEEEFTVNILSLIHI